MANETRHAAWHTERRFAVRLLPEEGDPTMLADGLGEFLEAVDFAVDWLTHEDPERTGTASLTIFETSSGEPEKVWVYPPEDESSDDAPLMKIFGFDPVTWKSPSAEYTPREPALGTFFTRAPEVTATVTPPPVPRPAPVAVPPPAFVAVETYEEPPLPARPRLRPRRALSAAWADPVARSFLFLVAAALWLAVALSNAALLGFVVVAVSGLWLRRNKLIAAVDADSEDWL
jgi:hypothetical protein